MKSLKKYAWELRNSDLGHLGNLSAIFLKNNSVREFYQPYPSQFCDVEQHYQIRARATK